MARNGPNRPTLNAPCGANYVIRPDKRRLRLAEGNLDTVADMIEPGWTVERHLRDGDIVLFNRQPSLHRMSIMAHRVKVMDGKTFRLNPAVCPPYNADFDGDEMNLHIPQTEEARAEAAILVSVQENILSPRFGGPIIGGIHDHVSGIFMLTQPGPLVHEGRYPLPAEGNKHRAPPTPGKGRGRCTDTGATSRSSPSFYPTASTWSSRQVPVQNCDTCKRDTLRT